MKAFDTITSRRVEISCKLARVRDMLKENGLQGVIFSNHFNFSWITAGGKSFVANCFDKGATAILVTDSQCFAFCSIIEEPRIRKEEQLEDLGFTICSFGWEKDETIEQIRKIVNLNRVISDHPMDGICCRNDLIDPLRWNLTPQEQERFCYLGTAMSQALEEYLLTVRPGMTEFEIAGGISKALWDKGIEQVMHLVTADQRSFDFRHGLPTDKPLKKSLIVSINGRYHGLITTVSRMVCVGNVPAELEDKYRSCLEIESAAMAKTRPGVAEREIYDCLRDSYELQGWGDMFRRHGQGGCQGYIPREYMITDTSMGLAEKNRAYCYNPVIDGAKSEDAFLVEERGIRMITRPMAFESVSMSVNGQKILRPAIAVI